MTGIAGDMLYSLRTMRARPAIAAIAVLSLALGIGANAVIFSVVDGMFLRPLAVADPESLATIRTQSSEGRQSMLCWRDLESVLAARGVFREAVGHSNRGGLVKKDGETTLVLLDVVTPGYFRTLGVKPALGRFGEPAAGDPPAVYISDGLWRRQFSADPAVIGKTLEMTGKAFTVLAVLPSGFHGLRRGLNVDTWVPASSWRVMGPREFEARGTGNYEAVVRLPEGVKREVLEAKLDALAAELRRGDPVTWQGRKLLLMDEEARAGKGGATLGSLLLAVAGLLVLIACANVAILLLAQADGRSREIGIRLALGAGSRRLLRQLLTESAALAALGGTAALLLARWMIPLVPALMPPGPEYVGYDIRLDGRVLAVTVATCFVTVLIFGMAPALHAARLDLNELVRPAGAPARRRFFGRGALVAMQAALGVVLLTSAGLLARSFFHTAGRNFGFDSNRNLLLTTVAVDGPEEQVEANARLMAGRVAELPGVRRAEFCRRFSMGPSGGGATRDVVIPGREAAEPERVLRLRYNQVSTGYFAAAGTRLLAGRVFTDADHAGGAPVTVVNETMVRKHFPGKNAVGASILVNGKATRIVGVVEDAIVSSLHEDPEAFLYVPFAQLPTREITFVIETAADPGAAAGAIKKAMEEARPGTLFLFSRSLRQYLSDALYSDRAPAILASAIGMLGVVLSATRLFGVVLHWVERRKREMGIRIAIGAGPRSVALMVLRRGLALAGAGAAAGAVVSLASAQLIAKLLYGVSPYDPATIGASVGLILAVAVAASAYPAWRALRVDPSQTLKSE